MGFDLRATETPIHIEGITEAIYLDLDGNQRTASGTEAEIAAALTKAGFKVASKPMEKPAPTSHAELQRVFLTAWRGLRTKYADNPARQARAVEEYKRRLREAETGDQARGAVAELCAEGGITVGGIQQLAESFAEFWRWLQGDWQEARDACLLAAAVEEENE